MPVCKALVFAVVSQLEFFVFISVLVFVICVLSLKQCGVFAL